MCASSSSFNLSSSSSISLPVYGALREYDKYLASQFKYNYNYWSSYNLCYLIYHGYTALALDKIAQIKRNEAEAETIIKQYSPITFPLVIDSSILPPAKSTEFFDSDNILSRKCLNSSDTIFGLSAVLVAVIKSDKVTLKALLDAGADPNGTDHQDWTPLHHASLHSNPLICDILRTHGARLNALNSHNGTPEDIWNLTHHKNPNSHRVVVQQGERTETINSQKFYEKFNCHFIDEMMTTPGFLLERWAQRKVTLSATSSSDLILRESYSNYRGNLQHLYISDVMRDDQEKNTGIRGFGLHSSKEFIAGQVVAEYVGREISDEESAKSRSDSQTEYLMKHIAGNMFRGYAAFANDAFPNCYVQPIVNLKGMHIRMLLVALENIPAKQEIVFNYHAGHPVKEMYHRELRPGAVNAFITTISNSMRVLNLPGSSAFEKGLYLNHTPSTLFTCLLEGRLNLNQYNVIAKRFPNPVFPEMFDQFLTHYGYLSTMSPFIRECVVEWFVDKFKNSHFLISVNTFFNVAEKLKGLKPTLSPSEQANLKKLIVDNFQTMWIGTLEALNAQKNKIPKFNFILDEELRKLNTR